jgi:hypothetical protein
MLASLDAVVLKPVDLCVNFGVRANTSCLFRTASAVDSTTDCSTICKQYKSAAHGSSYSNLAPCVAEAVALRLGCHLGDNFRPMVFMQ